MKRLLWALVVLTLMSGCACLHWHKCEVDPLFGRLVIEKPEPKPEPKCADCHSLEATGH